jgi:hypothetical protein
MTAISDFPNELLLQVFPHLALKSLIRSQGVCRRWRLLVPLSNIPPSRRALLELYVEITSSPFFERTRPWTLANLRPFDRNEYLDALLKQHDYIPEAFRLWILEWPARAVIGNTWPGLPYNECTPDMADSADRREGVNRLGCTPPRVSIVDYENTDSGEDEASAESDILPGLLIWSGCNGHTWLMLDRRHWVRGKVYHLGMSTSTIYGENGDEDYDRVYVDWVEWQRSLWRGIERVAGEFSGERGQWRGKVWPEFQPRIPARAWARRDEPRYIGPIGFTSLDFDY